MNDSKKYTIGEISKLCSITPRQLRYYDTANILKPSYRNPDTGYRYYTEDQIELLIFLSDLKNIGISNDSIQRLFVNRDVDQLVQELQINLAMVEQEINIALSKYRSMVNALVQNTKALSYLHGNEALHSDYGRYWISVAPFPKMNILCKRYSVNQGAASESDYLKRIIELSITAKDLHTQTTGTKLAIFHHGAAAQLNCGDTAIPYDIEVAREINDEAIAPHAQYIRSFGGFTTLSTVYVGIHDEKHEAYEVLYQWAKDHNLPVSDTSIEEYMVDSFSTANSRRFVTKIHLPLEGSKI